MACGSCGSKRQNLEYEVSLPDGTKTVVSTQAEARILAQVNVTPGKPAPTIRAIKKVGRTL